MNRFLKINNACLNRFKIFMSFANTVAYFYVFSMNLHCNFVAKNFEKNGKKNEYFQKKAQRLFTLFGVKIII